MVSTVVSNLRIKKFQVQKLLTNTLNVFLSENLINFKNIELIGLTIVYSVAKSFLLEDINWTVPVSN